MKRLPLVLGVASLWVGAVALPAAAVKLAPEISWEGTGGRPHPLKQLRGQPVVLLIAPSPEGREFRKEVAQVEKGFLDFSARKAIFITVFSAQPGAVKSNVPFVNAANGAAAAALYGAKDSPLTVVVIGPDGNIDMQSDKVEPAQRILDVINNTFTAQSAARAGQ